MLAISASSSLLSCDDLHLNIDITASFAREAAMSDQEDESLSSNQPSQVREEPASEDLNRPGEEPTASAQALADALPPTTQIAAEQAVGTLTPAEQQDLAAAVVQTLDTPEQQRAAAEGVVAALPTEQRQQLAESVLGSPDQRTRQVLWYIVIWTMAAAIFVFGAMAFVLIYQRKPAEAPLALATTALGGVVGLVATSPGSGRSD
jgi:hypothetical protein